jgi:hypothetical protein
VHRWAREPDLLLETRHGLPQPRGYSGAYKVRRPPPRPALPDVKQFLPNISN